MKKYSDVKEIWEELNGLYNSALSSEWKGRIGHCIEELLDGRVKPAIDLLSSIGKKDKFIKNFLFEMKDKKFIKSLRRSTDKTELLKGWYSYATHLLIESQKTGVDVIGYLTVLNNIISEIIREGSARSAYVEMFV